MALTQAEMEPMPCDAPGCDHTQHDGPMFLHARCHMGFPTWVSYQHGVATVRCAKCEKLVAEIAVAKGAESSEADGSEARRLVADLAAMPCECDAIGLNRADATKCASCRARIFLGRTRR